jgi:putative transposase
MPYCNMLVHAIWSTKNRVPIISKELKPILLNHIKEYSIQKGIFINRMNCVQEHIHLLISLGTDQTIAKTINLLKGESSNWVNKQKIISARFGWQEEYIALSVSYSASDKVRTYIDNQEEHHRKKTFTEEYNEFMKVAGIKLSGLG